MEWAGGILTVNGNIRKRVFKSVCSALQGCLESQQQMLSVTLAEQSQPGYSLFWKTPPCCLSKDYLNYQTLESWKRAWKSLEKKDLLLTKTVIALLAFVYGAKNLQTTLFLNIYTAASAPQVQTGTVAIHNACLWLHSKPSKRPKNPWRCLNANTNKGTTYRWHVLKIVFLWSPGRCSVVAFGC